MTGLNQVQEYTLQAHRIWTDINNTTSSSSSSRKIKPPITVDFGIILLIYPVGGPLLFPIFPPTLFSNSVHTQEVNRILILPASFIALALIQITFPTQQAYPFQKLLPLQEIIHKKCLLRDGRMLDKDRRMTGCLTTSFSLPAAEPSVIFQKKK